MLAHLMESTTCGASRQMKTFIVSTTLLSLVYILILFALRETLQGPPLVPTSEIHSSQERSTDIRPPQDGDIEIRPQQERITDILPPQEKFTDILPPQDADIEIRPQQETITEIRPPQEGNTEIRQPQESSSEIHSLPGTSAKDTKPAWTFGDLAPSSSWQFDAQALKEVRDITVKLNLKEGLQRNRVGNFTKSKKDKIPKIGHHDTCALVGNGGVILGSQCGAEIDSNDFVIRIDVPVIHGHENDVGKQTDMVITNMKTVKRMHESSRFKNRSQDVYENRMKSLSGAYLVADKSVLQEIEEVAETYRLSLIVLHRTERIRTGTGAIASEIAKMNGLPRMHGLPSTGLITVLMSTIFCDHTHMYGFFPFTTDAKNNSIPYHYYPGDYVYPPLHHTTGSHNMNREYDFFRDLHSRGVLKMHVGPCGE